MPVFRIIFVTVYCSDYHDLLAAWRLHSGPFSLAGTFVVAKPLTASQRRRLPARLRDYLQEATACK